MKESKINLSGTRVETKPLQTSKIADLDISRIPTEDPLLHFVLKNSKGAFSLWILLAITELDLYPCQ